MEPLGVRAWKYRLWSLFASVIGLFVVPCAGHAQTRAAWAKCTRDNAAALRCKEAAKCRDEHKKLVTDPNGPAQKALDAAVAKCFTTVKKANADQPQKTAKVSNAAQVAKSGLENVEHALAACDFVTANEEIVAVKGLGSAVGKKTRERLKELESELSAGIGAELTAGRTLSEAETATAAHRYGDAEVLAGTVHGLIPKCILDPLKTRIDAVTQSVDTYWKGVGKTMDKALAARQCSDAKAQLTVAKAQLAAAASHPRSEQVRGWETLVAQCKPVASKTPVVIERVSDPPVGGRPVVVSTRAEVAEGSTSPTAIAGWTLFGVGLAAGVAGGIVMGVGLGDASDLESGMTGELMAQTRAEALEDASSAELKLNSGLGLVIGGGVAIVTGIVLLALAPSEDVPVSSVPFGGGHGWRVSF